MSNSQFERQFPKPRCDTTTVGCDIERCPEGSKNALNYTLQMAVWNIQKKTWLETLKWTLSQQRHDTGECNIIYVSDIEKEIKSNEKET